MTAEPVEKLDFKKILPIFVIVLIDLLGVTIIIPLMPLYATSFSATPFLIVRSGAVYPMMQFVAAVSRVVSPTAMDENRYSSSANSVRSWVS